MMETISTMDGVSMRSDSVRTANVSRLIVKQSLLGGRGRGGRREVGGREIEIEKERLMNS